MPFLTPVLGCRYRMVQRRYYIEKQSVSEKLCDLKLWMSRSCLR